MHFTREEFDVMVRELLYDDQVTYDMLCTITEKTLRNKVGAWCRADATLRGREYEDDIMQEIHIRVIKRTISSFLLKKCINGKPYNDDPEGFEDWLYEVGRNIKKDFSDRVRRIDFRTEDLDKPGVIDIPANSDEEQADRIETLKEAFTIVMNSDTGVYKVLTWIAQFVFMIGGGDTKIQSNEEIIANFEQQTLYKMYSDLLTMSKWVPWIKITKQQHERIMDALAKPFNEERSYGSTMYRDFYMKHGGAPNGKKSVSDWMNRMNGIIRRELDDDGGKDNNKDKNKSIKITSGNEEDKMGRCGDGSSDG